MKTNKLLLVILAIVVLLVVGGGYLYLSVNKEDINNSHDSNQAQIKVTSPNGGENINPDKEYVFSWEYSGLSDGDLVNIGFRRSDQEVCWLEPARIELKHLSVILSNINCDGPLSDLKSGGQYKFQVVVDKYAEGRGVADMSDDYFTILGNLEQTNEWNVNQNENSTDGLQGQPFINSISPISGIVGSEIVIKGDNLAGFEGDLVVIFEKQNGEKIELCDIDGSYQKDAGKTIKVKVEEPCQKGQIIHGKYSGIPEECSYVELTPGTYKVYTEPWGKRSNELPFVIIEEPFTFTIGELNPVTIGFPGVSQIFQPLGDIGLEFISPNHTDSVKDVPQISSFIINNDDTLYDKEKTINGRLYHVYDVDRKCNGDVFGCMLIRYKTQLEDKRYLSVNVIYKTPYLEKVASEEEVDDLISGIKILLP